MTGFQKLCADPLLQFWEDPISIRIQAASLANLAFFFLSIDIEFIQDIGRGDKRGRERVGERSRAPP